MTASGSTKTLYAVGSAAGGDSPYGIKDMSGNAREWVQDWYDPDYYANAPTTNPQGSGQGHRPGHPRRILAQSPG